MTRDEILNMPAGRELDALVAEKVMEWKDVRKGRDDYGGEPTPIVYNAYGEKAIWCPIPHYSTDAADAWQVVEHPKFDYFQVDRTDDRGNKWFAICYSLYHHQTASNFSDTAPLAICRAALLAVMEVE